MMAGAVRMACGAGRVVFAVLALCASAVVWAGDGGSGFRISDRKSRIPGHKTRISMLKSGVRRRRGLRWRT